MFNFKNISTAKIHACVTFFFKPYIQLAYKTAQNLFQTYTVICPLYIGQVMSSSPDRLACNMLIEASSEVALQ